MEKYKLHILLCNGIESAMTDITLGHVVGFLAGIAVGLMILAMFI